MSKEAVFVPFLGDFLSIGDVMKRKVGRKSAFSSPFLGTFFQYTTTAMVVVPLDGGFRPLSWGLSFN